MSLPAVHVKFENSSYNYFTNVAKHITESQARAYFVGKMGTFGTDEKEDHQRCTDIEYFTEMPNKGINKRRRKAYAEINIHHRINFKKHNSSIDMTTGIVDDLYYYARLNMGIDLNTYWQTHSPHFINIW